MRPRHSALETKTKTLVSRSQDQDRDLTEMNSSALVSRDLGLSRSQRFSLVSTSVPGSRFLTICQTNVH